MVDERELVGLLYRADYTQLSLTADFHGTEDAGLRFSMANQHVGPWPQMAEEARAGIRVVNGQLVIAPGGLYRFQEPDPSREGFGNWPDPDDLLNPRRLLGFTLAVREPIVVAGRDAYDVVATPGPWRNGFAKPLDRIEAAVDAETGILLRREEIFEGKTLRLAEFTRVSFGAVDEDAFSSCLPDDEEDGEDQADPSGSMGSSPFGGPGWKAAKTAANAAGSVLGMAVRHSPRREAGGAGGGGDDGEAGGAGEAGHEGDDEASMPDDEPFGDIGGGDIGGGGGGAAVAGEEFAYAIYRGSRVPFTGTLHQWTDGQALASGLQSAVDRHGWNGVGAFVGAVGDRTGRTHHVWRIQNGSDGRYRIDYLVNPKKRKPATAIACDGHQCWREYENRITVGPPRLTDLDVVTMVDPSWLLSCGLSGVTEVTFGGRRAFAVRIVTGASPLSAPFVPSATQVVLDAELGIVLLLVSLMDGKPAMRTEFRDVRAGADDDAFVLDVPPGFRVIRHDGGLLDEIDMPEPVRTATRAAGTAARVAGSGITAAKGFLDSLRGPRPPA